MEMNLYMVSITDLSDNGVILFMAMGESDEEITERAHEVAKNHNIKYYGFVKQIIPFDIIKEFVCLRNKWAE